jgi:hypothetical protein
MVMASYGEAFAAVKDTLVIAIGGIMNGGQGTGQLWIMGTTDIPKYGREFTKLVRAERDPIMERMGIHRIQSEVLVDKPEWIQWAHIFGMKKEGIMRQYTHDRRDCVMMAYVREAK